MRCACAKSSPRVRLKRVRVFVRSIVLAVSFSIAGLSSALVICVTGCTEGHASKVAADSARQRCHERAHTDGATIGSGLAACTHEPTTLDSAVLSFDTRPSLVGTLAVASGPLVLPAASLVATGPLTASPSFASHCPSTALRL
jgi:hypothetical protein